MKQIYLPTQNNFYPEGTRVKVNFEGCITKGFLWDADENKRSILIKTLDNKGYWAHNMFVTLD